MRHVITLASLAVIAVVSACGGGGTSITPEEQNQANGFESLMSPREVAAANPDDGTRTYNSHIGGFYSFIDGEGFELTMPERFVQFEPASPDMLPHQFVSFQRIRSDVMRPSRISLDFEWLGPAPTGSEGLYIGYADAETDRWVWRGPIQSEADFADFSDLGFESEGFERTTFHDSLAVVNYSSSEALVRYFYFSAEHLDDVAGDEWLYFVAQQGDVQSIKRAPAADLAAGESLITGESGEVFSNLRPAETNGGGVLFFNRQRAGMDSEVWQSELDGSSAQMIHSQPGGIEFFGLNYEGDEALCFKNNSAADDRLIGYSLDASAAIYDMPMLSSDLLGPEALTYQNFDYYVLGIIPEASGAEEWGVMQYLDDEFASFDPVLLPLIQGESGNVFADLHSFKWASSSFDESPYFLYSFKEDSGANFEVMLHHPNTAFWMRNRAMLKSSEFDLRQAQLSPNNTQLAVIAAEPGMESGSLMVTPIHVRTLDSAQTVAGNVTQAAWFDPTPPYVVTQ